MVECPRFLAVMNDPRIRRRSSSAKRRHGKACVEPDNRCWNIRARQPYTSSRQEAPPAHSPVAFTPFRFSGRQFHLLRPRARNAGPVAELPWTSEPLRPAIHLFLRLVLGIAIPLLEKAFELIAAPVDL